MTKYLYDIGQIIKLKNGKIKIIKQILNNYKKYYNYTCELCGNEDSISESNLKLGKGCNVCSGRKVLKGYNDLATAHPHLMKYLVNKEDGYKYSNSSNKKILCKCQYCGYEKEMKISHLSYYGFSCKKCGDGISYSNKFMYVLLNNINIKYKQEYSSSWSKNMRYDFYLSDYNLIIEMDGAFHYIDNNINGQTVEKSQEIDSYKDKLAKEHGLEVIRINCNYNNKNRFDYIKNNVINSKLNNILDLSNVDWNCIKKKIDKSLLVCVCEYFDKNTNTNTKILSDIFNIDISTVRRYLNKGTLIGLCNYNGKESMKTNARDINKTYKNKKVLCITTNEVFNSLSEACKKYNLQTSNLSKCCKGLYKYCGKFNNIELRWMYFNE